MESGNVNAERMVKKKEAGDELATREGIDGPPGCDPRGIGGRQNWDEIS